MSSFRLLFLLFVTAAVPLSNVHAKKKQTRGVFLKIGTANDRRGRTQVILLRVNDDQLTVLTPELTLQKLSLNRLKSSKTITPAPQTRKTLNAPQPRTTSDSQTPTLTYSIDGEKVKTCTNLGSFKTFLDQVPLFTSLFSNFEISATNENSRACALRVQEALKNIGIPAKLYVGKLSKSAVTIFARSGILQSQTQSPTKVSPRNQIEDAFDSRYLLKMSQGNEISLNASPDGWIVYSFPKSMIKKIFPATFIVRKKNGRDFKFEIKKPTSLILGENKTRDSKVAYLQAVNSSYDYVQSFELPESYVSDVIEKYENELRANSWRLAPSFAFSEISDTQLPLGATDFSAWFQAEYRITRSVSADLTLIAPFSITNQAPYRGLIWLNLVNWLKEPKLKTRNVYTQPGLYYGASLGGFYFHQEKFGTSDSLAFFISDLMSLSMGGKVLLNRNNKYFFDGELSWVPHPPLANMEFSSSYRLQTSARYCWTNKSCLKIGFQRMDFSLKYKGIKTSKHQSNDMNFGYEMVF